MNGFTPEQLSEIKFKHRLSDLFQSFGIKVRGGSCLCPSHIEKTPSCKVYDKQGKFHCFGCGVHGDHFDLIRLVKGLSFHEAVKYLGGVRELSEADVQQYRREQKKYDDADAAEREKKVSDAQELFDRGEAIKGTLAATYLRSRSLTPTARMWRDLRFLPKLMYRGFKTPTDDKQVDLGEFPVMLAAIRMPETGKIIGCHRTYLQPDGSGKLDVPGDKTRNKAKKILGEYKGGWICLSPPADTLMMGEGIETSQSAAELEVGGYSDVAVAAGVNLWNMCGSSTGSVQHPRFKNDAGRTVPNMEPDPERAGLILPGWVKRCILLGDGDSDPVWTRAMIGTAAARMRAQGIETFVGFAERGKDWNNVLQAEMG